MPLDRQDYVLLDHGLQFGNTSFSGHINVAESRRDEFEVMINEEVVIKSAVDHDAAQWFVVCRGGCLFVSVSPVTQQITLFTNKVTALGDASSISPNIGTSSHTTKNLSRVPCAS